MKYVYLVRAGEGEYKVGVASNILSRVKQLQTSNAHLIEVIVAKQTVDAPSIEKTIHKSLHMLKLNGGTEWFKMTPEQALDVAIMITKSPTISVSDVQMLRELMEENMAKQQKISGRLENFINQFNFEKTEPQIEILAKQNNQNVMADLKNQVRQARTVADEQLYIDAINLCAKFSKASTSLLQRHLLIGYGRAARIMERLETDGYVTGPDGSHPRTFLGAPARAKSILDV